MLWLWLQEDCKFSKYVLEESSSLVQQETTGTQSRWVTYGRLQVLVGEQEATELSQELPKKPHPLRADRFLYLFSEEYHDESTTRPFGRTGKGPRVILSPAK